MNVRVWQPASMLKCCSYFFQNLKKSDAAWLPGKDFVQQKVITANLFTQRRKLDR